MKAPKRGEIWWFDVPKEHVAGTEQHGHPGRPYLVVSSDLLLPTRLCIACPITSRDRPIRGAVAVEIDPSMVQVAAGEEGLCKPGLILVHQIRALDYTRRLAWQEGRSARLGRLLPVHMGRVDEALYEALGLR